MQGAFERVCNVETMRSEWKWGRGERMLVDSARECFVHLWPLLVRCFLGLP